jgi:hypothetical protein
LQRSTFFLLLLLVGYALHWLWRKPWGGVISTLPAIASEPAQRALEPPRGRKIEREGRSYFIEHTHDFDIAGEVVSTATYSWTFTNPFYEIDLGLIWGPRTEAYKKKIKFYQGARWLMWSSQSFLSAEEARDLTQHAGNLHLIPANAGIEKVIRWTRKGDKVRIQGSLVRILDEHERVLLQSSTRRDDSGEGACELVWVDAIQIGTRIYR